MKGWASLSKAAESAGINRNTIARWVQTGKIKSRPGQVRNLVTVLVNLAEVRKRVAAGVHPGRPRKSK